MPRLPRITLESPPIGQCIEMIVSEIIGTFMLVFFGCLCVQEGSTLLSAAIGWGFTVGGIVHVFRHIGHAHVNPSVTLSFVLYGRLSPVIAIFYFFAQLLGSTLGYGLVRIVSPKEWFQRDSNKIYGLCTTMPGSNTSDFEAVVYEFMATVFLIGLVCSILDPRNANMQDSFPLKAAIVIVADVLAIGDLTGCSINSARSFGPALINGDWDSHWVYWVGPLTGSVFTTLLYVIFFYKDPPQDTSD